ncbi:uncharacterized protein TNCV_4657811 [Trichonephila clavipes]|nr:uncharacterized protein TNCV_4657811 [Trichonephila clavipes]
MATPYPFAFVTVPFTHHDITVVVLPLSRNIKVCISVNQNVTDIIGYIHETLLAYTEGGSKLLGKQYHALLIPGGDFNIDFDKDEGLRLVQLLKSKLNLDFYSGKALQTTRNTLNSSQAASVLVRLVEGKETWECSDHPQFVSPKLRWNREDNLSKATFLPSLHEGDINNSLSLMILENADRQYTFLAYEFSF